MQNASESDAGQKLLDNQLRENAGMSKDVGYGAAEASPKEDHLFSQSGSRLYCLDIARIVCVGLVVVNHGGTTWSDRFGMWNEMYVQQWVLQWLYMICGMSFAMSSRSTYGYLSRLAGYFVVGVCINWSAWIIKGADWKSQFWNVIFQFWFVFGLMVYIVCLTPLKRYLKALSTECRSLPPGRDLGLINAVLVCCTVIFLVHVLFKWTLPPLLSTFLAEPLVQLRKNAGDGAAFWGLPENREEARVFLDQLLSFIQVSVGSVLILSIFPRVSNRLALTNWLVLANVFIQRCIVYRSTYARIVDGLDFTMIGMANFFLGLYYRKTIGKYLVRYWFFVLFVFALLIPPGTFGRFDESTIHELGFRIRFHLVELAMVLLFLCAAERMADSGIMTEDKLAWLSWWALYLFLLHKFVHDVVPHPFNWAVLIMLAPLCWYIHGDHASEKTNGEAAQAGRLDDERADVESALAEQQKGPKKALQAEGVAKP